MSIIPVVPGNAGACGSGCGQFIKNTLTLTVCQYNIQYIKAAIQIQAGLAGKRQPRKSNFRLARTEFTDGIVRGNRTGGYTLTVVRKGITQILNLKGMKGANH